MFHMKQKKEGLRGQVGGPATREALPPGRPVSHGQGRTKGTEVVPSASALLERAH